MFNFASIIDNIVGSSVNVLGAFRNFVFAVSEVLVTHAVNVIFLSLMLFHSSGFLRSSEMNLLSFASLSLK